MVMVKRIHQAVCHGLKFSSMRYRGFTVYYTCNSFSISFRVVDNNALSSSCRVQHNIARNNKSDRHAHCTHTHTQMCKCNSCRANWHNGDTSCCSRSVRRHYRIWCARIALTGNPERTMCGRLEIETYACENSIIVAGTQTWCPL